MQRIYLRKPKQDNQNNKRSSTSFIDNNDQQEQIPTQSPYLTLLINKFGIPKEKAERACVATGFRSMQAAIDWLAQRHADDSNKLIPNEFILLLCPDERLNEQIRTFTSETFRYLTKETSYKDRQHLRAFKLSSFFTVPDQYVYILHRVFDSVINQHNNSSKQVLKIVLHVTSDYLMLIPEPETKKIIDKIFDAIKQQFEQMVPNVPIVPAKKLAHLTLTHGLSSLFHLSIEQRTSLIQLAKTCLDFNRPINWTFRLYSREQLSPNEVIYRVISSSNETTSNNCLLLKANDLFMVLENSRTGEEENVFGE